MRYDGGKGIAYPHIINLMPPHSRYIETHLGGGAVMRNKKPAAVQIGLEIDERVIQSYGCTFDSLCTVIQADSVAWLAQASLDQDTLVYVDPPYHPSTRRRTRVYRHDYSEQDHEQLLALDFDLWGAHRSGLSGVRPYSGDRTTGWRSSAARAHPRDQNLEPRMAR